MISPGALSEVKDAVTALMVITVAVSAYGSVRSKEITGVLSATFVFTAIFAIALWATAMLGLDLASTANMIAFYIAVIWVGIVIILLVLTLGFVIFTIAAISEVSALRSFIADMRIWSEREVGLWLPATIVRAIASELKDMIKGLFTMAYIYAIITAAVASYLTFLTH